MADTPHPADSPSGAFAPSAPFDDLTADTVLRSCDGCHFRVHRLVLSRASPFFDTMFSLPQPAGENDVPIIEVAEPGRLLDCFLRVWYPGADMAAIDGLDELDKIMELALAKYDMRFLARILQKHVETYTETSCVAVFALACRYGWRDVAKAAARQSLKLDFRKLYSDTSLTPHLKHISADHLQALLRYHNACSLAASSVGPDLPWLSSESCWIKCSEGCDIHPTRQIHFQNNRLCRIILRTWIFHYIDAAAAILKDRPAANVQDPSVLVTALSNTAACNGICRTNGPRDLAVFITKEFIPAVNSAIEAVPLEISF
ncbi:hypothetical protein MSAN_00774900 [Mycena sanguinolenta]|uniref:BTB domain-containing protein n=1 Tax=Mycena sanguinolenta TaxID=230812 RepID=A0A8H6Z5J7_9AGAR|nr:hypothetical protein MSAN_00774900 [Mycena sanguinolenta]